MSWIQPLQAAMQAAEKLNRFDEAREKNNAKMREYYHKNRERLRRHRARKKARLAGGLPA